LLLVILTEDTFRIITKVTLHRALAEQEDIFMDIEDLTVDPDFVSLLTSSNK
jgi:hypothetical protein